jgi:LacI family transcriptional regulator
MAITIKDVARQAGVSIATVSRVMNEVEGVSPKTREGILKIASGLHYYANFQARGLVAQKPEAIGIVIPQTSEHAFSNPYYAEILKGIGAKTNESGQYIVLSLLREENYARLYHHSLAAGIIVLANRINDPGIEEARKMKTPMVLIPGDPQKMDIPSVDGDNADGILQAVDYLCALGHRSIAILYGPMDSKYSVERLSAFRRALRKNRVTCREGFLAQYDFTQQDAYVQMKRLLALESPPTAVLLMNDYGAMGGLRAVKEMGYGVPQDISILGFGDVPFASMTDPPLTTVREPFQEMGYQAANMLLKLIQGKRFAPKHVVLPVELVIRKSTAPPR